MNTKCLFSLATLLLFLGQINTAAGLTSFELHNINKAHQAGFTGNGVKIGIVDTIFTDHSLLNGQFLEKFNNAYTGDKAYHGNHVAGIAAANQTDKANYGIAYGAKIIGFGNLGVGITDEQVKKTIENGVKVINNSHTGSLPRLQNIAKNNDILVVYSAGNNGEINTASEKLHGIGSKGNAYGESYDIGAWLVVGNVNQEDVTRNADGSFKAGAKAFGGGITYSNLCNGAQGYCVFAAGTKILSAETTGEGKHTGTSMAAPAVTGIAALVAQKYSFLGGKQLADVILSTANSNIEMPNVIYKKIEGDNAYYVIYIGDKEGDDKIPRDAASNYDKNKILEDLKKVYGDSLPQDVVNNTIFTTMTKEQIFGQGIVDAEKALKGLALLDVNRLSTSDVIGNTVYYTIDTKGENAEFSNNIDQRQYDKKYHQNNDRASLAGKNAGFKKTGQGTLSLAGNLNYLGDTIVEQGEINLTGSATKTIAGGFQVKNGAKLSINTESNIAQNLTNAGTTDINKKTTIGQTLTNQNGGTLNINAETSANILDNAGKANIKSKTTTQTLTNQNGGTLNINAETSAKDFTNNGEANIQGITTVNQTLTNQNGGTLNINAETSANTLDNAGKANIKSKTTTQTLTNQGDGVLTIGTASTTRAFFQNRNTNTALLNVGQNLNNKGTANIFESISIGATLNNSGTLNINAETSANNLVNSGETNIFAETTITKDFQNLANGTANIGGATTIGATLTNQKDGTLNINAETKTNAFANSGIANIKGATNITNDLDNQSGGILTIGEAKTATTTTPTTRRALLRNSTPLATIGNDLNNAGLANINAQTSVGKNLNNQNGGTLNINAETNIANNFENKGTANIDANTKITQNLNNQGTLNLGVSKPQTLTIGGKYTQGNGATLQLAFLVDDSTNSKLTATNYDISGGSLVYAPLSASVLDRSIAFDLGNLSNYLDKFNTISLNSNGYALSYSLTSGRNGITITARPNVYADFSGANPSLASVLRAMSSANISNDYKTFFSTLNASDFASYQSALIDLNDLSHLQYNNLLLGIQNQDILDKVINLQTESEGVFLRPRYAHLKAGLKAHRAGFEFYANKNTTIGGFSTFINYDNLSGSDVSSQLVSLGLALRNTTALPIGIFGGARLGFANNTVKKTQSLQYKTQSASLFAGVDKNLELAGDAHFIPTFYVNYHYFHQENFHHAGISYRGTAFFNRLQTNGFNGNNLFARNIHAKNSNFASANLGLTFKQNLAQFWNLGIHGFYERRLLGDKFKSSAQFTDFGGDFEQSLKISQNFFRLGLNLNYELPMNANGIGYFASVGVDYETSSNGIDRYRAYGADFKGGIKF